MLRFRGFCAGGPLVKIACIIVEVRMLWGFQNSVGLLVLACGFHICPFCGITNTPALKSAIVHTYPWYIPPVRNCKQVCEIVISYRTDRRDWYCFGRNKSVGLLSFRTNRVGGIVVSDEPGRREVGLFLFRAKLDRWDCFENGCLLCWWFH